MSGIPTNGETVQLAFDIERARQNSTRGVSFGAYARSAKRTGIELAVAVALKTGVDWLARYLREEKIEGASAVESINNVFLHPAFLAFLAGVVFVGRVPAKAGEMRREAQAELEEKLLIAAQQVEVGGDCYLPAWNPELSTVTRQIVRNRQRVMEAWAVSECGDCPGGAGAVQIRAAEWDVYPKRERVQAWLPEVDDLSAVRVENFFRNYLAGLSDGEKTGLQHMPRVSAEFYLNEFGFVPAEGESFKATTVVLAGALLKASSGDIAALRAALPGEGAVEYCDRLLSDAWGEENEDHALPFELIKEAIAFLRAGTWVEESVAAASSSSAAASSSSSGGGDGASSSSSGTGS